MEAARPTTGLVNSDQGCIKGGIAGLTARVPGDAARPDQGRSAGLTARVPGDARARAGRTPAGATGAGQDGGTALLSRGCPTNGLGHAHRRVRCAPPDRRCFPGHRASSDRCLGDA